MASRLPFKIDDVDKECDCTFFRCQIQQSARNDTRGELIISQKQEYTDADFAREMQGLSFQERERVHEDVHLASGQVKETEEFVTTKVQEIIGVIDDHSKKRVQRDAWDRAVFLRPALAKDGDHYLIFLRSTNYDAYESAMMTLKFYELKRRLWGDELLPRLIGWENLSEETRAVHEQYYGIFLPRNRESRCRQVRYYRPSIADPHLDPIDYIRAMIYPYYCHAFANKESQRNGQIVISDLRGPFKMSIKEFLEFCRIILPMLESVPGRVVAVHFLVEKSVMAGLARSVQSTLA